MHGRGRRLFYFILLFSWICRPISLPLANPCQGWQLRQRWQRCDRCVAFPGPSHQRKDDSHNPHHPGVVDTLTTAGHLPKKAIGFSHLSSSPPPDHRTSLPPLPSPHSLSLFSPEEEDVVPGKVVDVLSPLEQHQLGQDRNRLEVDGERPDDLERGGGGKSEDDDDDRGVAQDNI